MYAHVVHSIFYHSSILAPGESAWKNTGVPFCSINYIEKCEKKKKKKKLLFFFSKMKECLFFGSFHVYCI